MGHIMETPTCTDAVLIVPGIMGSELRDAESGRILWGLANPSWYLRAWTSMDGLSGLLLDDDERSGRYGRVQAVRLLRFAAFAPMLRGIEPYTRLLQAMRRVVAHPLAVDEFPYDWRLPVKHNARLLAETATAHLRRWESEFDRLPRRGSQSLAEPPKIIIVAHSMGGLLARAATASPEFAEKVRLVVTLGTPFFGSVKAALLLGSGRGSPLPLPASLVHGLAAGMPAIYDLLPTNRCVDTGSDARTLSIDDVLALGGDHDLVHEAFARRWSEPTVGLPVRHVQVVGAHQPTWQSMRIEAGVAYGERYTCSPGIGGAVERVDVGGDGTVSRQSAQLPGSAMPLAQSHGAIAKTPEAILVVVDALTQQERGPWLGEGRCGFNSPDVVTPGQEFEIILDNVGHPRDADIVISDVSTERPAQLVTPCRRNEAIVGITALAAPGLYRISVSGGGNSPVSELILCASGVTP